MVSVLLLQAMIRRCRSGMLPGPLRTTSSLTRVIQAECMSLHGLLTGSVSPLAQGMATLMGWIIVYACGMSPPAIRSMFIVVIVILCMPWHGHQTASDWPRQVRAVMCKCGRRCKPRPHSRACPMSEWYGPVGAASPKDPDDWRLLRGAWAAARAAPTAFHFQPDDASLDAYWAGLVP